MKLLHLSDLHFTADDGVNHPLIDRISFVKQNYSDHFIVITGDVIDNEGAVIPGTQLPVPDVTAIIPTALANPPPPIGPITPHLNRARTALGKAFATLSTLPQGRVFICAGNHDFGLWGNLYAEEYTQAFDDLLFTPILNRGGPTDGSVVTMISLFVDEPVLSARKPIHYTITSGGVTLSLIGLCTAIDTSNGLQPLALATGIVGGRQLTSLQTVLNPIAGGFGLGNLFPKVVFMHHHPWIHEGTMELTDASDLMSMVRNNAQLIMFGHKHHERRYEANSVPGGGLLAGALAAGSSRVETGAWEVTVNSAPIGSVPPVSFSFNRVRII